MSKKSLIKFILIFAAVFILLYLGISQFGKIGTSNAKIANYNLSEILNTRIDSLGTTWVNGTYINTRDILADAAIARGMAGINEEDYDAAVSRIVTCFSSSSDNYFTHSVWRDDDLTDIKHLASYLKQNKVINIVDGHYGALKIIANSKVCSTQDAVNACISGAEKYNKTPWTFCAEVKDGLSAVKNNALNSYTLRTLIPTCKKLDNYAGNYSYFDDFDVDYQKVKNGKSFLESKGYTNANFNSLYNAVDYNGAANNLDPRF